MTFFLQIDEAGNPASFPITDANFRLLFPGMFSENHVFLPSDVEPLGYGIFEFTQAPSTEYPYKAVETLPQKREDGLYYQSWAVEELTQAEKDEATEQQAARMRRERTERLFQSDWTILPFTPVPAEDQLIWAKYRQDLRDITKQSGFPWSVVWPTPPSPSA